MLLASFTTRTTLENSWLCVLVTDFLRIEDCVIAEAYFLENKNRATAGAVTDSYCVKKICLNARIYFIFCNSEQQNKQKQDVKE